jgi:H+-translocating NAD(P) transhydrogenase subunit alpha
LMTGRDDDGHGVFSPDYADEILSGSCVTQDGRIVHEPTREAIEGPAQPPPSAPQQPPEEAVEAGPPDVQLGLPYDQEADQ